MDVVRFAPSPTGWLHVGHAFSAWFTDCAKGQGGTFLLRLEDIDTARVRPEYVQGIFDDLEWLGLTWPEPVLRQSERLPAYAEALEALRPWLYRCFCSRKDIAAAVTAPHGPGEHYPGTCRALRDSQARADAGEPFGWRLDTARAIDVTGPLKWFEDEVEHSVPALGDPILARRDHLASYHLCCVVDDAYQGVTLVTRGDDLRPATHIHRLLQALLGLPTPRYRHHGLVLDEHEKRLAKRDGATSLRELRARGLSPGDVLSMAQGALRRT